MPEPCPGISRHILASNQRLQSGTGIRPPRPKSVHATTCGQELGMNNPGMNKPGVTKYRGPPRRPLSFVVAGFLLALSALSARADDSALCDHSADNPDASIPACTRLLDAARNDAALLPEIYTNRGIAWVRKGLYASAIDDFNSAIQYDPKYVDAY